MNNNYFKTEGEGNFFGLLKLLASENPILAGYLTEYKKQIAEHRGKGEKFHSTSFLSARFINICLETIEKLLVSNIVTDIIDSGGIYALELDTTTCVDQKSQCSVVARYVNNDCSVMERNILLLETESSTGAAIFDTVNKNLKLIGLDVKNHVGFSMDGASNMRSKNKGVNYYFQKANPKSLYTWCSSHRFNLIIESACKTDRKIKTLLHSIDETNVFLRNSVTRMKVWRDTLKSIKTLDKSFNCSTKPQLSTSTRWCSKFKAVNNIINTESNYCALIITLHKLIKEKIVQKLVHVQFTNYYLGYWTKYKTIIIAFLTDQIMSKLNEVTSALQAKGLTMIQMLNLLKDCATNLNEFKQDLDNISQQADTFAKNVRLRLIDDDSCDFPLSIFQKSQFILDQSKKDAEKFVDILLEGIQNRILSDFEKDESVYKEISYFDPYTYFYILSLSAEARDEINIEQICQSCNISSHETVKKELVDFAYIFFKHKRIAESRHNQKDVSFFNENEHSFSELHDEIDELILNSDQNLIFEQNNNTKIFDFYLCGCLECILKILKVYKSKNQFASLFKIYKYICTLPCTQVNCERSFSKLKNTKNKLRSKMTEEKLSSLIIIQSECDILKKIEMEQIVDEVAASSQKIAKLLLEIPKNII